MEHSDTRRCVKIVCTLGPASSSSGVVQGMLEAGMNVARLNLSYGSFEEHSSRISDIRALSDKMGLATAVMLDLPGRKRRSGGTDAVFGEQIEFARTQNADYIALSFITSALEVVEVRTLLEKTKTNIPIITKIERAEALENCEAILDVSDGIMVARGDLALGISIEKVPLAQKRLISEANRRGKPVITATQMLESMTRSPMPTRAEATDVANAVLDGSDAIMLSEETAIGSYPAQAVTMMARIAVEAEKAFSYDDFLAKKPQGFLPEVNDATARAACQMALQVQAKAIVAFTTGGTTAFRVSKYRPHSPILAVTPSDVVRRRLALLWGVLPVKKHATTVLEEVFQLAREVALETGIAVSGDLIVITAGLPLTMSGSTNLLKVHTI